MPPDPSPEMDVIRQNLMEQQAVFEPMWEAAKGVRERLMRDGWSETYAEMLAAEWTSMVLGMIRKSMMES